MRTTSCLLLASLLASSGCSKGSSTDSALAADDAPPTAAAAADMSDPCSLLSLGEVRRLLPEANKALRNDKLASQGINGCEWYGSGKAPLLEVSVWQASGPDETPMENASTLAMGFADPLRGDTQAAVRIEKIAGVGEQAVAIVEEADAARGILTTGGLLTLQKNGRIALVTSSTIANRERAAALDQLATLGKAVAARL
jgi:hypothetical protein